MRNRRIPIAAKLLGGFGIVLALVAVMGWLSVTRMAAIDEDAKRIFEVDLKAIVLTSKIEEGALLTQEFLTKGVLATLMASEIEISHPAHAAELKEEGEHLLNEAYAESQEVTLKIEELLAGDFLHGELLVVAENLQHDWEMFLLEIDEVRADEAAGLAFEAGEAVLSGEGEVAFAKAITELDELRTAFEVEAGLTAAEADATYSSARTIMFIIIAITVALGAGVGLYLSRSMSNGAAKVSRALERVAQGDLTQTTIDITSVDEFGDMATAYGTMIGNLREIIGSTADAANSLVAAKDQLSAAAEQAAVATGEMAKSVGQVAEGTTQQAQSVQEVNEGIERLNEAADELDTKARTEVAESAVSMAESAKVAADGADQAAETARTGVELVQKTVEGIDRIKVAVEGAAKEVGELGAQSEEIGKIVGVIEDIAAQTNLLALNAAIEAARAGEQGRGFAVVADEVRQLAERVSNATKEIATLIDAVQAGVAASVKAMEEGGQEMDAGTVAAAEASTALEEILSAVDMASSQIQEIAAGAEQLRTASDGMVQTVEGVKTVVANAAESVSAIASVAEENSAATEQVSASTEELSAQVEEVSASAEVLGEIADRLSEQVSRFRLTRETAPAAAHAAPQPEQEQESAAAA